MRQYDTRMSSGSQKAWDSPNCLLYVKAVGPASANHSLELKGISLNKVCLGSHVHWTQYCLPLLQNLKSPLQCTAGSMTNDNDLCMTTAQTAAVCPSHLRDSLSRVTPGEIWLDACAYEFSLTLHAHLTDRFTQHLLWSFVEAAYTLPALSLVRCRMGCLDTPCLKLSCKAFPCLSSSLWLVTWPPCLTCSDTTHMVPAMLFCSRHRHVACHMPTMSDGRCSHSLCLQSFSVIVITSTSVTCLPCLASSDQTPCGCRDLYGDLSLSLFLITCPP